MAALDQDRQNGTAAFEVLQCMVSTSLLPQHVESNLTLLARMRILTRCTVLLCPEVFVKGEEEACQEGRMVL